MVSIRTKLRVRNSLLREALAEILSTFILLSFGNASVAQSVLSEGDLGLPQSIHWSWGIGVMLGIYVAGGISGAHMNPAVTVAQACTGNFSWKKVPVYCIAQYIGSFLAAICVYLVYFDGLQHFECDHLPSGGPLCTASIWATYPRANISTWNCFGDQVFATALLLICIFAINDPRNMQPSKGVTALCVGLLVVAIGMTFGFNCGYAINPARDLAPRLFTLIAGWGVETFSIRGYNYFWVPVVGPHIGGILGAFIYQLMVGFHWPDDNSSHSPSHDPTHNSTADDKPRVATQQQPCEKM